MNVTKEEAAEAQVALKNGKYGVTSETRWLVKAKFVTREEAQAECDKIRNSSN